MQIAVGVIVGFRVRFWAQRRPSKVASERLCCPIDRCETCMGAKCGLACTKATEVSDGTISTR